jgi:Protein of unknown function (DUF2934)
MSKTAKNIKEDISSNTQETNDAITLPGLDTKVAEIAYYKAETRGFAPGYELNDWLEAEQELNLS